MKTVSTRNAAGVSEDDATRIYRAIFESVMSQRLAPGTKLREAALCELFGVGRTVIRKVLQALAHDHILELRPNRGAVVAAPTPQETREIFAARRALEAAILPLAAANATRSDYAALKRQLPTESVTISPSTNVQSTVSAPGSQVRSRT